VNDAKRILVIGLLLMVGAATAYVFLNFGGGAFSRSNRIAILVLHGQGEDSPIGPGYGLSTTKGIPGVFFGLMTRMRASFSGCCGAMQPSAAPLILAPPRRWHLAQASTWGMPRGFG
jgi:hypothetical protein